MLEGSKDSDFADENPVLTNDVKSGNDVPRAELSQEEIAAAVNDIKEYVDANRRFIKMVNSLEALKLPNKPRELTWRGFISSFIEGHTHGYCSEHVLATSPMAVSAIAAYEFFKSPRFEETDFLKLESYETIAKKPENVTPVFSTFEFANQTHSAPLKNIMFLDDKESGEKFVVQYGPSMSGGQLQFTFLGDADDMEYCQKLAQEVKVAILKSPLIKGQVIEMEKNGFQVIDIGNPPAPVMDEYLQDEIEKNITGLFKKKAEFEKYNLPIKRSIILSGPPGCGKTMIERHIAAQVRGEVTTVWVSAKAIETPNDISDLFFVARSMSPVLMIFEDIDMIAGTRDAAMGLSQGTTGSNCLGELLNQLDGLQPNDSMVVIASTNRVSHLDEAISNRPGRIDRIYEVKKPSSEVAQEIAIRFMRKSNIAEETIESINLASIFKDGENTGAQVVEIIKGAIFESVHRGCTLDNLCVKASQKGLEKQRELLRR